MEILQFKSKFPREVLLCRVCYYLTFYLICIFYDFEWNKNMVFHRFLNKGKWNLNAVKTGMVHSQSLRDLSEIAFRHIIFLCFLFTYYSPNPNWEIHLITVTCYLSCYELSTILTCKWQEFIIFEYLFFFYSGRRFLRSYRFWCLHSRRACRLKSFWRLAFWQYSKSWVSSRGMLLCNIVSAM